MSETGTEQRRLLIVEDDAVFARTLARSFERRGYAVQVLSGPDQLESVAGTFRPGFAVVDLRLAGASGLSCIEALHRVDMAMRIVVLTGFASIATAVEAIKLGATNYLTKPANTDDIEAAFAKVDGDAEVDLAAAPTSIKTLEWEHIHQTLADSEFNISEAARRLGMHRRTLARKLDKRHMG
ncbi:two-component system response regulator RegA [Sphingomonas sp. SORGH_AS802]|jgi:two-component system response regulator RegA|uniref:response regulator transcription factor n=1 Tax=unclassified Sphingomonas TaxID=196159 RepID=UPI000F7F90C5|nr:MULTISPECIES: response regulator transcription factor [unclassified Sphingomonas]MDR6128437.1 two-component system response regulator RegA [Sphingomonas sp. SORGH_AS_0438]MDR6135361.1 two-component system response regulator RegA [Sphingomonas sp. SORGH_AS_0802]RSU49576.1 two-component system response regulator [Sphingomonas sp. S-NIH.Pt15_0812]